MPKWFEPTGEEEILDQFQFHRNDFLRDVLLLTLLTGCIHWGISWLDGSHNLYGSLIFGLLLLALNSAGFAYHFAKNAWVLTDERVVFKNGRSLPLAKIEGAFEKWGHVIVKARDDGHALTFRLRSHTPSRLAEEINTRRFN